MVNERLPITSIMVIGLFATILSIVSPLIYNPGTIINLDGQVGRIDNAQLFNSLDILSSTLYLIGDYTCHQMISRSWTINGNQLFICIRDYCMMIGFTMGVSFCNIYWSKIQNLNWKIMVLCVFLIAITIIEWLIENNSGQDLWIARATTSLFAGIGGSVLIAKIISLEYQLLDCKSSQKENVG